MAVVRTFHWRRNNAGIYNRITTRSYATDKFRATEALLDEYIDYITNLPKGQAGRLSIGAEETPATTRRRLGVAAKTLGIPLIIKRSGTEVYFWREDAGGEQPGSKRRYTRRERSNEETTPMDQAFVEIE